MKPKMGGACDDWGLRISSITSWEHSMDSCFMEQGIYRFSHMLIIQTVAKRWQFVSCQDLMVVLSACCMMNAHVHAPPSHPCTDFGSISMIDRLLFKASVGNTHIEMSLAVKSGPIDRIRYLKMNEVVLVCSGVHNFTDKMRSSPRAVFKAQRCAPGDLLLCFSQEIMTYLFTIFILLYIMCHIDL